MDENILDPATLEKIKELIIEYTPKLLLAVIVLFVGFWVIGRIVKFVSKVLQKSHVDISLQKFFSSIISVFLKLMLILSVASMIGINTTSFVAITGALMVGIGMALNGSIGHFASGVLIMFFKPFKVGDLVKIGDGQTGTVEAINTFNTTLKTLDNKRIIIANSNVTGNTITNITGQEVAGVELTFGIAYGADIDEARSIILAVGKRCEWVLDDPKQMVVVAEWGDSSVNLASRPFCKSEHYWETKFFMQEHVKKEFDRAGIEIPFPQMDVHMIQPKGN
ncbi:mechanosensitive ion channel family protein [Moheibacter lacus]|uniref:Mechanosensitive ion channel family protein n=1 Tax=Moheibacter lacus TaxID=2745851 RepID=A0A838ZNT6_9FLAO|nr:mechanosensitive ion channel family protein [Moheibacter lacus]MBA5629660.1 mechanosensitive ion channel family protein [Moheibacter lacus]